MLNQSQTHTWARPHHGIHHVGRPVSTRPLQPTAIAPETGPLSAIQGRRVLVLADVENLSYSARNLSAQINYGRLAQRLIQDSRSCSLHAFFSSASDRQTAQRAYFEALGWRVHQQLIEVVRTHAGTKTRANIDNLLLFEAGLLCSRTAADTIVIASGDGDLGCDLAAAIAQLPRKRDVLTLSLAGSTSWRLNGRVNPHIHANLELGTDCLQLGHWS